MTNKNNVGVLFLFVNKVDNSCFSYMSIGSGVYVRTAWDNNHLQQIIVKRNPRYLQNLAYEWGRNTEKGYSYHFVT